MPTKSPVPKKDGGGVGPANLSEVRGLTVFRTPQRFDSCRVCDLYVGASHPPAVPYEKHLSDWVTGCPIFMPLSTVDRFRKAREAEFCVNCFDKNIKFVNGTHIDKQGNQSVPCVVTKESKHRYSCTDKNCLFHMWVCRRHKKLNEQSMKKHQTRIQNLGGTFNFNVTSIAPVLPPPPKP